WREPRQVGDGAKRCAISIDYIGATVLPNDCAWAKVTLSPIGIARSFMLRQRLSEALKGALKSRDERTTSTVRMILAGLKDRDIAERGKGKTEGLTDAEIHGMLQSMIKQRRESIVMFEKGNRPELVQKEQAEIGVIERFLPKQMSEDEMKVAIKAVVAELGAARRARRYPPARLGTDEGGPLLRGAEARLRQ